jgi:molybdate transport system ATP-binding protein
MATFELAFTLTQGSFALAVDTTVRARALALYGPSGSGKTTIVETIAGLRAPARGRIAIDGRVLVDTAAGIALPSRDRRVGYVPQDGQLVAPHLDVHRNITYARPRDGHDVERVAELLDLAPLLARDVGSLSGGERQRVAIARALLASPVVLLLDEPLAAVDLARRRRIVAALLRIRDELGVPIVYVTHAVEEARLVADQALVVDAGRVVASGAPGDVLG